MIQDLTNSFPKVKYVLYLKVKSEKQCIDMVWISLHIMLVLKKRILFFLLSNILNILEMFNLMSLTYICFTINAYQYIHQFTFTTFQ